MDKKPVWDGSILKLPQLLLDELSEQIWVKDVEGRYQYINEAYRHFFGVKNEDRLGLTDAEAYPPDPATRYRLEDLHVMSARQPLSILDKYPSHRSGSDQLYETIKFPLYSPQAQVIGVYAISRNITEETANGEKSSRQKRLLEALHEMSVELIKQHDIHALLKVILSRSVEAVGANVRFIEIVDPEQTVMKMIHYCGDNITIPSDYALKRGQGLAGQIWELGKVLLLNDYQQWQHRLPQPCFDSIRSVVGVPIFAGKDVIGVVTLCHTDPLIRFDETDVSSLEQFSAFASVALENARLLESAAAELLQRRESEELYRALVEQSSDVILLFDPATRRLLQANSRYLELAGYSAADIPFLTAYDVVVDERRWIDQSFDVVLPKLRSKAPEMRRYRRKDGSVFDLERSATMVSVGDRNIIMSVGRDVSDRRHIRLMEFLHETTLDIIGHLDSGRLLEAIVKRAITLVDAPAGYCALLKEGSNVLEVIASIGCSDDFFQGAPRIDAGLAAQVWNSGKAAVIDNYCRLKDRLPDSRFDCIAAIAILPLKNSVDKVIGILTVFHWNPDKRIRLDDFACLEELSHLTSLALDNTRLYNTARLEIATRAEIELQIRQAYEKLDETYDTTLEGWAKALDLRDCETEGHSRRVASVAVEMAKIMNIDPELHIHIWRGALLHDIGKLGVPDSILLKPGPLTAEEWQIMRLHPVYGYDWLQQIEYLHPALAIPRSHHERWDGEGYPDRLKGDQIPLEARIFAPIDVWDALSSNRPYRRSWPETKIREHIRSLAGSHFDPVIVEIFLSLPPESLKIQAKAPGRSPRQGK